MNKQNKHSKFYIGIWILAALILAVIVGVAGWQVWSNYKQDIISQQEEQMQIITDSLANSITEDMESYYLDAGYLISLIDTEGHEGSIDADWQAHVFGAYLQEYQECIKDLVYADMYGNVLYRRGDFEKVEEYDTFIIENATIRVQDCSDDKLYFVIEKCMSDGCKLQLYMDVESYYKKMISEITIGKNGYVVLKSTEGRVYMHPASEQIGATVIDGRKDIYGALDFSSLEGLLEKQIANEKGVEEYYSYWWTNPDLPLVKKVAAHTHVNLGDGFMIVSIVMDYEDITDPIDAGFISVAATLAGIFLVLVAFAAVIVAQMMHSKKNKEEIAYLKDLNEVLEKTKKGEEAIAHQQRLQIMGTMTGGIAHEFNNMLTPIMGYSEMLVDVLPEGSEEADYAQEILNASDKAKDVIKQISSMSRKNMETVYTFIPVKKALKRTIKMVHSVVPSNVMLLEGNSFTDEGFWGNETQLNQVLLNICVNAFHAIGTEKQGVVSIHGEVVTSQLMASRHSQLSQNDILPEYICLCVEDNGCGMEPDILSQIFDPFFSTKGKNGTGLGLSLAEQIIHSHKGYIFAVSKPGVGSRFFIYLPKVTKAEAVDRKSFEEKGPGLKILALDDNEKVLQLLKKRFGKLGIYIKTTDSAEAARESLEQEHFDVILIDQNLSRIEGQEKGILFAISIGQTYPDLIKLIMTDTVDKEIIEARQHGFIDDYVEKPVSDGTILEVIRRINRQP